MISWLQSNEKHFRIIFILLLAVIIVAFVFTIGAAPGITGRDERTANLSFFDQELDTEIKRRAFFDTAYWSAYMKFRGMRLNQQNLTDYAFNRATALYLANDHSVPAPSPEQLKEFIQTLPLFQGPGGEFDADAYTRFLDDLKLNRAVTEGDIFRILGDDYRIQKVFSILSGPGFVLDSEVLSNLKADKTEWSIAVAEYDLTSFEPEVEITDEAIQTFYDNNSFRYATPPRRIVDFAQFKAFDLQSQIAASEEELQDYYDANAYKYTKPGEADPAKEGEEESAEEPEEVQATFEEALEQVTSDYKLEKARELAMTRANTFALALVEAESRGNLSSEAINGIAAEQGLTLTSTSPFAANETPLGLSWSRAVVERAFRLSPSQVFGEPILEGDNALVLIYKDEIPETVPALMTIRERIESDYKTEELTRLRSERSQELGKQLKSVDSAEAFNASAESEGLSITTYEKFTRREPAEGLDRSLVFNLDSLSSGDVSEPSIRGDKAYFVYVAEKNVPDLAAEGEEFETSRDQLKSLYERYAASQYINKLTQQELVRSGLAYN